MKRARVKIAVVVVAIAAVAAVAAVVAIAAVAAVAAVVAAATAAKKALEKGADAVFAMPSVGATPTGRALRLTGKISLPRVKRWFFVVLHHDSLFLGTITPNT
jgi:hypothetical protein